MPEPSSAIALVHAGAPRWMLASICGAAYLLFAQTFMIAPLISRRPRPSVAPAWSAIASRYATVLPFACARRTYAYVFLNAILQAGVFTWLGFYLHQQFGLSETGIGLVLLGYGIPGLLFGPVIGKLADRYGRASISPAGAALTGVCALALWLLPPLLSVQIVIILLSLGFDRTDPQLAAIATDLRGSKGQAVALMAFSLFTGFGLGSLLFQAALILGFSAAFDLFGATALVTAGVAVALFRHECPNMLQSLPHPR